VSRNQLGEIEVFFFAFLSYKYRYLCNISVIFACSKKKEVSAQIFWPLSAYQFITNLYLDHDLVPHDLHHGPKDMVQIRRQSGVQMVEHVNISTYMHITIAFLEFRFGCE
jgi:hypothetical protein